MDLDFSNKEKIVGTFTICITILILATVIIIGRGKDWFRASVVFYATFSESYNLKENASVKMYSTDIGMVKDISITGEKVKLTLKIYEDFAERIKTNAIASVESPTLIGDEYLSIKPGSNDFLPLPPGSEMRTVAKKSFADILQEFEVEKTAKMVVAAIQGISETAQELRAPQGPLMVSLNNIEKATGHFQKLTKSLEAGEGTAGSILQSRELIEALLARIDKIGIILDNLSKATEKTPLTVDLVNTNLETLKRFSADASGSFLRLENILKEVDESIQAIKTILTNVEAGSHDIPAIIQSARQGIDEIRNSVDDADRIIQSIQKNPLIRGNLPP
ncbi:MAG: MCE family protein, partial [Desulfobacterales bacterium]|nr:MCE family protein [Desulfobacterales bacterium]